jgi:polyhydroxyalkanoate synthase
MTSDAKPTDRSLYPRPLGFHIMMSAMTWNGAVAGLPAFCDGYTLSHASLTAEGTELSQDLARCLKDAGPALTEAVTEEALARIQAMINGVRAYHAHPYVRSMPDVPVMDRRGSLTLLDYGAGQTDDRVVVAVPSLINPSFILDLGPDRSLMRYLGESGFHPLLVDWGSPGEAERDFNVGDYVTQRLESAVELAARKQGGPVPLIGYCMGGNLALALAARRPDLVSSLLLLATPWDFHAASITQSRALAAIFAGALTALKPGQTVPVDLIQLFFASLDPTLTDRKFRRFATLDQTGESADLFVAIEDWNNGGAPLAAAVARECLGDWYGENLTARGEWMVGGMTIDPAAIEQRTLVVAPRADRIVPPVSALALGHALPNSQTMRAKGGHVTMIVGPTAPTDLWSPVADWLRSSP